MPSAAAVLRMKLCCKLRRCCQSASACVQVVAQHRLLLSGTPIQNDVAEIWGLFDFLMPGLLGTEAAFRARFRAASRDAGALSSRRGAGNRAGSGPEGGTKGSAERAEALEALHRQVLPFVLRRTKDQVLSDLPPKLMQVRSSRADRAQL